MTYIHHQDKEGTTARLIQRVPSICVVSRFATHLPSATLCLDQYLPLVMLASSSRCSIFCLNHFYRPPLHADVCDPTIRQHDAVPDVARADRVSLHVRKIQRLQHRMRGKNVSPPQSSRLSPVGCLGCCSRWRVQGMEMQRSLFIVKKAFRFCYTSPPFANVWRRIGSKDKSHQNRGI